jgi:hypothetical protein
MAKLEPQFVLPGELSEDDVGAIVAIGREQAALMDALETALRAGDTTGVVAAAKKLVRLERQVRKETV